jgi:hypothetical protein
MGGGSGSGLRRGRLAAAIAVPCVLAALLGAGTATAAGISGRVSDTSAQPLLGIEVCALTTGPFGSEECTQTDAGGEYAIPSAGPGYLVHFYTRENRAPGYAPQWYPGKPFFEEAEGVAAGDVAHVDAVMAPGGTVTGTALSTATSMPIEGVEVCPDPVIFREREITWCTHSDANGEFTLRGLSTAEYRFEFRTSGDVNYVEQVTPPRSIQAGDDAILDVTLVPGVKVEGTLTEAGTGLPVEGFFAPYSVPSICALDAETEARIKCTTVGQSGNYSLPGLPPMESFGVAFAVDGVEEGLDLHPDGYVRQYWDQVSTWGEAAHVEATGGATFGGVNAALTRGGEVFPHCEVASACSPSNPIVVPPATFTPNGFEVVPGALRGRSEPELDCRKGYLKVKRIGHPRCIKVQKKKHKLRHHRKYHEPANVPST